MTDLLSKGLRLRSAGRLDESRAALLAAVRAAPGDAQANYQCAWAHDIMGLEREAIQYYEQAISAGLSGPDLEGAFIGLGSSCRVVGDHAEAAETLTRGTQLFPESRPLRAFLALALHDSGQPAKALGLALRELAETSADPGIASYRKALLLYADELRDR